MAAFAAGEIKVLIATTVIEVGVNVPNANLMVIEGSRSFWLSPTSPVTWPCWSQRHTILLCVTDSIRKPGDFERLQIMRTCGDGFILAEKGFRVAWCRTIVWI